MNLRGLRPGKRYHWWHVYRVGTFIVGVRTGPERDLLCVLPCKTNEEAELWLSPPARTIWGACLGSLAKKWGVPIWRKSGPPVSLRDRFVARDLFHERPRGYRPQRNLAGVEHLAMVLVSIAAERE